MDKKNPYNRRQCFSAVFMALALLWLTISAPFVAASQQQDQQTEWNSDAGTGDDESNPLGNTQEEKAPSSTSLTEEFLHEYHDTNFFAAGELLLHPCVHADTYIAYHGELLVPPPNSSC